MNSGSEGVPEVVERCSGGVLTLLEMLLMKNCVAGRSVEFLTSSSTYILTLYVPNERGLSREADRLHSQALGFSY